MKRRAAAVLCMALAIGCGGAEPSVRLSEDWPAEPGDYEQVLERWTRSGRVLNNFDRILDVTATFKSPEWRAAYVERMARRAMMSPDAKQALAAEQRAEAAEVYEVELLVSTYHHDLNDLQKGDRSAWRVVLVDAAGNEIAPASIERDRREREVIEVFFPHLENFHVAYIARFPKTHPLLSGGGAFKLKVAGAKGGVELEWKEG